MNSQLGKVKQRTFLHRPKIFSKYSLPLSLPKASEPRVNTMLPAGLKPGTQGLGPTRYPLGRLLPTDNNSVDPHDNGGMFYWNFKRIVS